MRNGDNVVAQRLLIRCLELNPCDSHSWLALAQLEAKLGNIERARDVFSQSVMRCPNNVYVFCSTVLPFISCSWSLCLSYPSITACLLPMTLHDTSLTIISSSPQ
jgi:hypothetical protein